MKLTKYSPKNVKVAPRGKPTIRFAENGAITLSSAAVAMMKLKQNDTIIFLQDEEHPEDWYITKDPQGFSFRLVVAEEPSKGMVTNSSAFVKLLLDKLDLQITKSVGMLIGKNSTEIDGQVLWPLLTTSANKSK